MCAQREPVNHRYGQIGTRSERSVRRASGEEPAEFPFLRLVQLLSPEDRKTQILRRLERPRLDPLRGELGPTKKEASQRLVRKRIASEAVKGLGRCPPK